jgi:hypothetical protein
MTYDPDDDDRHAVRRGVEHIPIRGTTEELGLIVPSPVVTQADLERRRDDDEPE